MQHWTLLAIAILFEVAGTTSLKLSDGFTKLVPSVLIFIFYSLSFVALSLAIKRIDISIAYAIWSGIGTALIALIGVYYFRESMNFLKLVSLGLIIIGVIGLHISIKSPG